MNYKQDLPAITTNWSDLTTDFSIDRVSVIDEALNIVLWNRASELASGLDRKDVIGKQYFEVFASLQKDQQITAAIEAAFAGQKAFVGSDRSVPHRLYYENHFIPLFDNNKKVLGVMNIMHDVAHRIKVEDELRSLNNSLAEKYEQLEKLSAELSNFTSITTQNIKEPLKYIYSSLELLISSEGRSMSDSGKAGLRRMQVSLNRINWLIDDIVELFGLNSVERPKTKVAIDQLIVKVKQKLSRKISELSANIIVGPMPVITGNHDLLVLLFQSLIDNAIRFREDNTIPNILISSSTTGIDEQTNQQLENGKPYFCISVRDNGFGIDPAHHKRIFRMFEQLNDKKKFPGTGLGLAFAEKIMQHHNGFIRVESSVGNGTVFNCYFPVDSGVNS